MLEFNGIYRTILVNIGHVSMATFITGFFVGIGAGFGACTIGICLAYIIQYACAQCDDAKQPEQRAVVISAPTPPPRTQQRQPQVLAKGWKKYYRDDGVAYYFNETTMESSWVVPAILSSPFSQTNKDTRTPTRHSYERVQQQQQPIQQDV